MKDFFVYRTALRPTLPSIITVCLLLALAVPARAAKNARVQIGFVGTQPVNGSTGTPLSFQNILLNIVAIRINSHVGAGPNSAGWQKIPAPPGVGGSSSNAELQIDLLSSQNIPQLFNTAGVRVDNYKVVQLQLDQSNPGSLIPTCPASPPADGCIVYPLQLNNPNGIEYSNPGNTVVLSTKTNTLVSFVMQVSVMINKIPTGPGGAYTATLSIAPVTNPSTGTITGQVNVAMGTGTGTSTTGKLRKLSVTAEPIGTNIATATAPINNGGSNCPPSPGGCFTLTLPAAGPPPPSSMPFGTLYDLAVSGGAVTYAAARLPPLDPGASISVPTFKVTGNQTLGNITGTVSDGCAAGKTIAGATLDLLMPPNGSTDTSLCMSPATVDQCVTVASANTDNAGNFPLPGTVSTPAAFANVPTLAKKTDSYAMEVTAPGYDPLFVQAIPGSGSNKKGGGTCSVNGGVFGTCNLLMQTGYITGSIPIIPPNPGQTTLVQVFAEDHNTNNIESALPMPKMIGSNPNNTDVTFTLNVPPSIPVGFFDLFASTIDFYQGVVDPYQGHSIVAISHVPAPAACATVTAPTPTDPTQVITCVGHGSITGTVSNPNLGSSVVLEKIDPDPPPMDDTDEVQITNSLVQNQPPNPNASSNYGFCAPADTYQVQEFQLPSPTQSETPIAAASPSPVPDSFATVVIPPPPTAGGPSPTPTPAIKCPTNCSYPGGGCPGICNNVVQGLPPSPTIIMETPAARPTL
ncbi:hypothetical protein [Candidatus Binatus sp.]|uniref:hypothetical protein n=1 Tax=Candidatus Binatus sp. TaxID=2811406 RepID=UPI003C496B58